MVMMADEGGSRLNAKHLMKSKMVAHGGSVLRNSNTSVVGFVYCPLGEGG